MKAPNGRCCGKKASIQSVVDCGCSCVNTYKLQEQFDSSPFGNPSWMTQGNVQVVPVASGAWRLSVDSVFQSSLVLRPARSFGFSDAGGAMPNPRLSFKARFWVTPDPGIVDGVQAILGIIDVPHALGLGIGTQTIGSVLQWSTYLLNGNIFAMTITPTGIPVATSCATAQLFEADQNANGTVTLKVGGTAVGTFTLPPNFAGHLFAPGALMQRPDPNASGSMTLDMFCVTEGNICIEDPGSLFGLEGSWIQSTSGTTNGGDSTNNDSVNWTDLIQVNLNTSNQNSSLIAWAHIGSENNTVGETNRFRILVDGNPVSGATVASTFSLANEPLGAAIVMPKYGISPGAHVVTLQWQVSGGVGQVLSGSKPDEEGCSLLVAEVAV